MPDLVLRSRRVLVEGEIRSASIHIADGRIEAITRFDEIGGAPLDDHGDDILMPGVVDSHVHINEPGRTEWEGFASATRAAAAGGVTTIVDMPLNSIPATTTVDALRAKVDALLGQCHVDVGLWGGAVPGNPQQLQPLLDAGALGFKCFLIESGVAEFGHLDSKELEVAMRTLAASGAPLLVHAELAAAMNANEGAGRSYRSYLDSRPAIAEDRAIALVVEKAAATAARAHIVHLSSATGVPIIRSAIARSIRISAETTPHYLHFASEAIPDGAPQFKCAPPIRELSNREQLWSALGEGVISLVVSDHSPCHPDLKAMDAGDLQRAWGGISSLQFALPVVWTEARQRGFSIADVGRWMAAAPADLAGIANRKGWLRAGGDADVVVFDPEASFTIRSEMIEHRHRLTPYAGATLRGLVKSTYVRGTKVWENGQLCAPPSGIWIHGRDDGGIATERNDRLR